MLSFWRTAAALAASSLLLAPAAGAWSWPASGAVLRPFSLGTNAYAGGQHRGIDVGGEAGEAVLAPREGRIAFAGSLPTNGLSVTIETGDGYSVTLVHLGSIAVKRNSTIAEGSPVGTVGPSGESEWPVPYVHLGVRVTSEPNGYVDPLRFLPPRPASAAPAEPAPEPVPVPPAPAVEQAPAPPAPAPSASAPPPPASPP